MERRGLQRFRAILLLALLGAPVGGIDGQDGLRGFERASCPFRLERVPGNVTCGYLSVPESRNNPNGRTLRLAVAVLHSRSTRPAPDPVVFLAGGPGAGSLRGLPNFLRLPLWEPMRAKRDLVFYDQRGTGESDPDFCPELNVALAANPLMGRSVREQTAVARRAMSACRERLLRTTGLDFSAYNSASSARDLEDLRRALGYRQWNLVGLSYGTRLALAAMRDTPGGIRSVILDSALPTDARQEVDGPWRFARSLRLLFDRCLADTLCHRSFPTLEEDFYAALDDLERRPLVVGLPDSTRFPNGRLVVDGTLIAAGVFQALYDEKLIPLLPLVIEAAKARNASALTALAEGLVRDPHSLNAGLFHTVTCHEVLPLNPATMIAAERARYPRLGPWYEYVDTEALCQSWHDSRADPREFQPVRSDIPTLILSGEYDPITPPQYGRRAASSLTHSITFEAPGAGHFVLRVSQCARTLALAFLDDPDQTRQVDCGEARSPAKFVTAVHLNRGVYRLASMMGRGPTLGQTIGLGAMMLLLLSPIVAWPVGAALRKLRGAPARLMAGHRSAIWLARITALLALGFIALLLVVLWRTGTSNPYLLAFGVPREARVLFVLPWIVMVLTLVVLALALVAWRRRWWSLPGRLHYTLVAAACAGFVAWVSSWGLV